MPASEALEVRYAPHFHELLHPLDGLALCPMIRARDLAFLVLMGAR